MIVIIMGVSGCGKSTVGSAIARRAGWPFIDADDLHPAANVAKMVSGHPLTDADRAPWLAAIGARMDAWIASGSSGVIACSALRRAYRDTLRDGRDHRDDQGRPDGGRADQGRADRGRADQGRADQGRPGGVRFVFLDVDHDALVARLTARHGHFMPAALLESQFATLERPTADEGVVTIEVTAATTLRESASMAIRALHIDA